jgi:hypothetical protein
VRRIALVTAIGILVVVAGCSSGGNEAGVSAGHGSPKSAVEGFLTGLQSSTSNDTWCSYVDPAGQAECAQAFSHGATFRVHGTFAIGNEITDGNQALVAVTGNACLDVDADSTTSTDCAANTNENDGLPSGAQTFSEAYSDALTSSSFATAACIQVDGKWYLNEPSFNGSSSPTTTPPTTSPTSTPATTTPTTGTTPATEAVNYGQQFLTDVAPWNAATAKITSSDTLTSPAVIDAAQEAVVTARSLLSQSWPSSAQADVHTFAVELDTINEDVQEDNVTKFRDDVTTLDADANVVRADLGLPSIN